MKANELRIGNLVVEPSTGREINISAKGIEMVNNGTGIVLPIPLNNSEILRMGLVREDIFNDGVFESILYKFSGKIHILGYCAILFNLSDELYSFSVSGEMEYEEIGNHILYVHQLQNLYFALTGEELEIKD